MLDTGVWQGFAKGVVELIQHNNSLGARIVKLVDQFANRVHWIGVNNYQTEFPSGNNHDRILNQIG